MPVEEPRADREGWVTIAEGDGGHFLRRHPPPRFRSGLTVLPFPEVRDLVAAARRYLAGECYSVQVWHAAFACLRWVDGYNLHPAIRALIYDWGRLSESASESVLRERLREDLCEAAPGSVLDRPEDRSFKVS
ncbi:NYN domain-containing protein [Pyxidicoccus trucidator]|uniref:NYN domain-containing protein n=1 Tax=Pyxidicoccus trucidator TaxID=2709662 RepID=UPI001F07908E|nr:NYN domain-containing protein [Pyxidicoccus trucidator]